MNRNYRDERGIKETHKNREAGKQGVAHLSSNKLFQPFDSHPSSEHTTNRGKSGVIPGKEGNVQ